MAMGVMGRVWRVARGSVACSTSFRSPQLKALGPFLLATVSLAFGAGHAAHADNRDVPPLPVDWLAPELQDHPLAGKIWSRKSGGFIGAQEYGTALAKSRFLLLGEIHDNPDHHRLQAWAISTISKLRGARLVEGAAQMDVVAMEMLNTDQQKGLDKFYSRGARVPRKRTAEDFGRLVKWEKTGWPEFKIYQPIIAAAMNGSIVVTPASPSRSENRKVGKDGFDALGAGEAKRLGLDAAFPEPLAKVLAEEIHESHCGMLPKSSVPAMVNVQRFRDARMADAMLVSGSKGAALIAGNGHVRRDRGVPWYLQQRGIGPDDVTVVAHVEVRDTETKLADYGIADKGAGDATPKDAAGADPTGLADFVVFTARQPRLEPCEEMRRQMEAIKAHKKSKSDKGATGGGPSAAPAAEKDKP